jgi:ribosomal protein S14
MSEARLEESVEPLRSRRHRCKSCDRSAAFLSPDGRYRADPEHDLCRQCYRSAAQSARMRRAS